MDGKEQEIYTFDKFQLDVENGVLIREGQPVPLQWKAFETLCILVRSEGRLIPRDELIEQIWPDAFVEENNLSQHIRSIRKALGDGEKGIKFIETVPRRGFRFLPEVHRWDVSNAGPLAVADKGQVVAARENEIVTDRQLPALIIDGRRARVWPKVAALSTVAAIGLAAILFWSNRETPTERRIQYASKIKLAAQALDTYNLPSAKQILDETRPKNDEEDLRGFEWGYLARVSAERAATQPLTLEHRSVDSVAFSPDGKTLASAGMDNVVRLWSVTTGEQTMTLTGHTGWLISVVFSPDGSTIATGAFDRSAKVWDAKTGRELFTIPGADVIGNLTFSPDGGILAGADGEALRFWDASTGIEKTDYFKSSEAFPLFAFSPDGKLFAARSRIDDRSAIIWEIASGRKRSSLKGHSRFISDLKFSPDSNSLLTGSTDGTAKLWNLNSGKESATFTGHTDEVWDVAFSPDGKIIATGSKDDTIKVWETVNGYEITTLRGHLDDVRAIAFSFDGRKLASGSVDDTARIWNVPQDGSRGNLRGHTKDIGSLTFSPDGKTIASASEDNTAKLWDVETEQLRFTITGHTEKVYTTAFSPDGSTLATASADRKVKLWDIVTGRERKSIDSPKPATVLTFSPDGKLLATGHWWHDREVRLWDTASGTLVCSVDARDAGAWTVEFSKDGKQFLTTTPEDNAIRLWETASCGEISAFEGEPNTVYASFFAPDGKLLTLQVINNARSLKLLDIESGKELASFSGHEAEMSAADFSPDVKRLVTADREGLVKIWDVATGQELISLKTNEGGVNTTAFSPDGNVLATAGSDGTIRLWRTFTNN